MKKFVSLLLLLCLVLTMAACGPNEPDTPDGPGNEDKDKEYVVTQEMVEQDREKIVPEIESHSFSEDYWSIMIAAQEYDKTSQEAHADIRYATETPIYEFTGFYRVTYSVKDGDLVFTDSVLDNCQIELRDGSYPGEGFIAIELLNDYGLEYFEEGGITDEGDIATVEVIATLKDGNKVYTKEGYLQYRYDFETEEWIKLGFTETNSVENASYDDHTGIYDVVITGEIVDFPDGQVVEAYKMKLFTFDDEYIDGLRVGDVINLHSKTSAWGGKLKNVTVNTLHWDDVYDGSEILIVRQNDDTDFYYFKYDGKLGKWVLCHEWLMDGPGNGYVYYLSSEPMRLLISDKSKLTKKAYFDMTTESGVSDIKDLLHGSTNGLMCQLRAYHGVIDWCNIEWPISL